MKTTMHTTMMAVLSAMAMTAAAGCMDAREAEVRDAVEGTFATSDGALQLTYTVGDHFQDCSGERIYPSDCVDDPVRASLTAQMTSACFTGELGGALRWDGSSCETNLVLGALHLHTAPAAQGSIRVVAETWGSIDDVPDAVCLKMLVGEGLTLRRE